MKWYFYFLTGIIFLTSCKDIKLKKGNESLISTVIEKGGIKVSEVYTLDYSKARIRVFQPERQSSVSSGEENPVLFSFDIEHYNLGEQTPDLSEKLCANSPEGQHVHLILNNEPYTALYDADFDVDLPKGDYVALAFLSRSYHESLKYKSAYKLWEFSVNKEFESQIDITEPHLFYSRPKGVYKGAEAKRILLDFYLVNVDLTTDGYKVLAEINGISFILTKWVPYIIEGLPIGDNTIKLTLVDGEGHPVKSPYNPVVRYITLIE